MNTIFFRQIFILAIDEIKQLFFRKRAIFAIIIYIGILFTFFWALSQTKSMLFHLIKTTSIPSAQKLLLEQAIENFQVPYEITKELPIFKAPIPLIIYFIISLNAIPLLIPLISCDMISLDIFKGTQRFLLFRVSRKAYFFSKTIAHLILYFIIQLSLLFSISFYCYYHGINIFSPSFIQQSYSLTIRTFPFLFLFLSFTQMISSLVNTPIKSLIMNILGQFIMIVILAFKPVLSIFYWPLLKGLFSYQTGELFLSSLGYIIWSMLFLISSFIIFWRKKL